MSILIKGAKMPKECECCMFAGFGGAENEYYVCMLNGKWKGRNRDGRMESCPLVEIPPHGDLIDRDAVRKEFAEMCEQCGEKYDAVCRACYVDTCDDIVDDVPAVIESEEQENE